MKCVLAISTALVSESYSILWTCLRAIYYSIYHSPYIIHIRSNLLWVSSEVISRCVSICSLIFYPSCWKSGPPYVRSNFVESDMTESEVTFRGELNQERNLTDSLLSILDYNQKKVINLPDGQKLWNLFPSCTENKRYGKEIAVTAWRYLCGNGIASAKELRKVIWLI